MKLADIKKLTPDERHDKLLELKKEMMENRFKKSAGQLEKPHELRLARRTIARLKTLAVLEPVPAPTKDAPAKKESK